MIGPIASLATVVCGAWFTALPPGWHQSGREFTLLSRGVTASNTFSWAAAPRSVHDLTRPLPRDGVYLWIDLNRPSRRVTGRPLQVPLRLRDADVIRQEGSPELPEYRFEGRYRRQYHATVGVDFGRAHPTRPTLRTAQRALFALALPRWFPPPRHPTCVP